MSLTLALLRRLRNQRLEIEQRLDVDGRDRREVGGRAQEVAGGRVERRLPQPHDARLELRGDGRRMVGQGEHGAARDVDIGVELQGDGLALLGELEVAAHGGDAQDVRALAAQRVGDAVADADASPRRRCRRGRGSRGRRAARSAPASGTAPRGAMSRGGMRSQVLEQVRARVPGHVLGPARDVVAADGRDRNGDRLAEAEAQRQLAEVGLDGAEALLRPVGEVHLVDGEDDALHADDVEDGGVAARLRASRRGARRPA